MTIWIDGQWRNRDDARVSVFDHGLLYGDGLFEGLRIYQGKIFRLKAHLDRLDYGCKALMLDLPLERQALVQLLQEAVARDGCQDGYIRLVLTRGQGPLGMDPFTCAKPSLIVIVDTIRLYPGEFYQEGVPLVSSTWRRNPPDSLDPRIKSLNYLNNILAKIQARQAGAQEAVMLNHQGLVAECTGDNLIAVRGGLVHVPQAWQGALEGITLQAVLELAADLGLGIQPGPLTLYDLYTASEIILTGTAAELVPVKTIDGRKIGGPGPVFAALSAEFHRRVVSGHPWCD